jgi:two-component system, OmpR family, response regulator
VTRIGICEDDESVRRVLTEAFKMHGHELVIARNGQEALRNLAVRADLDVLVINIGLPDAGRDVCQALRASGQHAPVLFLTALDAVHDRVSRFRAGGDDYVPKPFAISEVLVRIAALHKRSREAPEASSSGLVLHPDRFSVQHGDREEKLTPTKFRLLATIVADPGTVVPRRAAVAAAWPDGARVSENTIDSFVRRLRVKLNSIECHVALETVRGVGFVVR